MCTTFEECQFNTSWFIGLKTMLDKKVLQIVKSRGKMNRVILALHWWAMYPSPSQGRCVYVDSWGQFYLPRELSWRDSFGLGQVFLISYVYIWASATIRYITKYTGMCLSIKQKYFVREYGSLLCTNFSSHERNMHNI